jgi:hypothetical protein
VANGKWVTVPANKTLSGRAERRWMQPSGELMTNEPGLFGGFVPTRINQAWQQLEYLGSQAEEGINRAGGYRPAGTKVAAAVPDLNAGMTGANWPAGVPQPGTAVDPASWSSGAPGQDAPDAYGDPAERARESEMRRMMQQYASKEYWATEEGKAKRDLALQDRYEGKDLAGYYGAQKAVGIGGFDEVISGLEQRDARYAKGGDLRAWAEANKDLALREYLKQSPAMEERGGPDRIAVEQAIKDGTFYAADGSPNPLGGKSQLVAGIDPGITMGPPAGINAEVNRNQIAEIQARSQQAAATDTGTTTVDMQPLSAVAQGFQQPAEPLAAGNIPPETLSPAGVDLRERYKRMIQNGANSSSNYGGGR